MKKSYLVLIIVAVTLLVSGIVAGRYYKSRSFELVAPKMGDVLEAVYGLGTVKSHNLYEFKAGTVMNLETIFVKEGDLVEKGQNLIQFSTGLIVKAPFAGTVTDLPFHEGENINAYNAIVQLQDLTKKYIEVSLEQEGALRIVKGQNAKIMLESLKGNTYQGKVSAIFPKDGSFIVHIEVDHLENNILPGMTADVSIEIGQHKNVLLIPISSIDAGSIIRIREDDRKKVQISIGHVDGNWAEVLEGDVKLTDQVVIPKLKKQRN